MASFENAKKRGASTTRRNGKGYVASLMTEERPNVFTQKVANIEPGKTIDIDITYFHKLPYDNGTYEFVFPMVVGPRFNPPGYQDGVEAAPAGSARVPTQSTYIEYLPPETLSTQDIALNVELDAGVPLKKLHSPTHEIDVKRNGPHRATVTLRSTDSIPNRDFVLRYDVGGATTQPAFAFHDGEDGGYFALAVHPPASLAELPAPPREMVFVLDCSGSMQGRPIAQAKQIVRSCLKRLRPVDSFQIIRFSSKSSQLGPAPLAATPANLQRGLAFVDSLNSSGGTMMVEGIRAALDFPHDSERYRIVAFLTDGYIGNDREIIAEVRQRVGDARIFSFGVGSSTNRFLMEEMARAGRGAVAYALPNDGVTAVEEFYRKIEHPALTNITVDFGEWEVSDLEPPRLPDLFAGRPVYLTGRFRRGEAPPSVRVLGNVGGQTVSLPASLPSLNEASRHEAIAQIWARARIARLSGELALSAYPVEQASMIRDVALRYGLLSRFTAFVAVDSSERTAGTQGTTIHVPVPTPAGVSYETTVRD